MQIQRFVLGMFLTNCYVVSGNCPGKCIVIDPADDADRILAYMNNKKVMPEVILLTHGHYDHFLAVPDLQKIWPSLPVYCHPKDCPVAKEEYDYDMGRTYPTVSAFHNVKSIVEQDRIKEAGFDILVLETPGHTKGSVTFLLEDAMFTGDTLFAGSIGRTDFAGGDERQMAASLRRLAGITKDYNVYPGHESITTLKKEKQYNPYLKFL